MIEEHENFLKNLIKVNFWSVKDRDKNIQVLYYKKDGPKLYYKPLRGSNRRRIYTGEFLLDRKNAQILMDFENDLISKNEVFFKDELDIPEHDGVLVRISPNGANSLNIECNGTGRYEDREELDKFFDYIIKFLDQGEVKITSIELENLTDYKLDEEVLFTRILYVDALYDYLEETNKLIEVLELESPVTGERITLLGIPLPPSAPDQAASFLLFKDNDSAGEFLEMLYEGGKMSSNDRNDCLLVEIIPKMGEFILRDKPFGALEDLTEDERREMVVKFLNIVKEVCEV